MPMCPVQLPAQQRWWGNGGACMCMRPARRACTLPPMQQHPHPEQQQQQQRGQQEQAEQPPLPPPQCFTCFPWCERAVPPPSPPRLVPPQTRRARTLPPPSSSMKINSSSTTRSSLPSPPPPPSASPCAVARASAPCPRRASPRPAPVSRATQRSASGPEFCVELSGQAMAEAMASSAHLQAKGVSLGRGTGLDEFEAFWWRRGSTRSRRLGSVLQGSRTRGCWF